jgi:hypothetical protein
VKEGLCSGPLCSQFSTTAREILKLISTEYWKFWISPENSSVVCLDKMVQPKKQFSCMLRQISLQHENSELNIRLSILNISKQQTYLLREINF